MTFLLSSLILGKGKRVLKSNLSFNRFLSNQTSISITMKAIVLKVERESNQPTSEWQNLDLLKVPKLQLLEKLE
jgi:hypothetical protein